MVIALPPIPAGKYIVAVSGGVDSMVLLELLRQQSHLELCAAHVDHGIRADSSQDEALVKAYCASHNIKFVSKKLNLGSGVGEAEARKARYDYLRYCRDIYKAEAIITAHHQDDLIETAIINIMRGTGWRGLAPFTRSAEILRPLVDLPKSRLTQYAKAHGVDWRNDSTNQDQRYLRNYVRLTLIPLLTMRNTDWRTDFLRYIRNQQALRRKIEPELTALLAVITPSTTLRRYDWIILPSPEAYELFQTFCRQHLGHSLERSQAEQALLFIKTARPHKQHLLVPGWRLRATRSQIIVEAA